MTDRPAPIDQAALDAYENAEQIGFAPLNVPGEAMRKLMRLAFHHAQQELANCEQDARQNWQREVNADDPPGSTYDRWAGFVEGLKQSRYRLAMAAGIPEVRAAQ